MGAEMQGCEDRGLYTRTECFLVSEWCSLHDTRTSTMDGIGSWDFPPDIVKKAHSSVPEVFDPNTPIEGWKRGSTVTEEEWNSARQFLKETAEANCDIRGSY